MVPSKDQHLLAIESRQDSHRPLDHRLRHRLLVEEIPRHHQEMGTTLVRGRDDPFQRGEAFLQQALADSVRIPSKGNADVIVSRVEDTKVHEENREKSEKWKGRAKLKSESWASDSGARTTRKNPPASREIPSAPLWQDGLRLRPAGRFAACRF
jgi:hypothetical protein